MAIEFAKLYSTNGKLIYDEYFQLLKEEEDNRVREHDAASLIQLKWHEYKERKYRRLLQNAVIKIQKFYRGYISRVKTKKRIIEENRLRHRQYYNEKAILIQKIWRGYHSRKEIFDYYAYKQYLKDVTEYGFKVNDEIKRHAEQQRKQMESDFLENEEKKIQSLAGRIHHIISTKLIDGVCKYPHQELNRLYREKALQNELRKVDILPHGKLDYDLSKKINYGSVLRPTRPTTAMPSLSALLRQAHHIPGNPTATATTTTTNTNINTNTTSKIPIPIGSNNSKLNSKKSKPKLKSKNLFGEQQQQQQQQQQLQNSPSQLLSSSSSKYSSRKNSLNSFSSSYDSIATPPFYEINDRGLTEDNYTEDIYSSSLQNQDIYTLNEKQFANLSLVNKEEYTGYEFENYTDILKKKDKLFPPISTIPESVIKNSNELKNWKNANINRPKLVLRREIVFKEDIPKKYLQKKAEGPFLPTYLLNRKMKGPTPDELSLHNQTNIYETPNKFKEDQIENDKKILCGTFNLSQHLPIYKHQNILEHNEPWVQPKDPNAIISETPKFEGKHDFRTRLTNLCYDAYREHFE
jgi:hypothetical protein